MAYNNIKIKRRTSGNAGAPASLLNGELAMNEVDNTLYYGSASGVIAIAGAGTFATNTLVAGISADLQTQISNIDSTLTGDIASQVATINSRIDSEVADLNTTISSVSSTLDAKIDSSIAAVIDMAPEALNTLNELAAALGDDENFASNLVSTLGNVNTTIASVSSDLQGQIDSEVSRATAAEGVLTSDLASEVSRATAAEAQLTSDLSDEVSRATAAEAQLTSDLSDEVSRATAAEGVLTSDLASEVSRATAAEAQLTSDLSDEVSRATAAEGVLTSDLASEVSRATAAESALASDLAAVNTRVDNVLSNVDAVALNSLSEIVTAFQEADSDLNDAISLLAGNGSTNLASVSAALQSQIDSEVSRATAAEAQLTSDLSDEVSRATAAEGVLTSDLASEVSRATTAEAGLASDLSDEVARATAAESALDVRVSDIEGNYLDKRVGGTVNADLTVAGNLEVGTGANTTLFVGEQLVGINTEAPSEALDVSGNGKFSGNVYGSGTSTLEGFVLDGGEF